MVGLADYGLPFKAVQVSESSCGRSDLGGFGGEAFIAPAISQHSRLTSRSFRIYGFQAERVDLRAGWAHVQRAGFFRVNYFTVHLPAIPM